MKNLKKVLAVLMVVAMLFALNVTAFAATSDPYLVVGPNTLYSTPITANSVVTLAVTTADSTWHRTGFSSDTDAEGGICAYATAGCDKVSVSHTYGNEPFTNYYNSSAYLATINVTGVSNAYGPASIHVQKRCDASAYIDLTVYVEAATIQGPATGISIKVFDAENQTINEYANNMPVYAAADANSTYGSNIFYGMAGCAQSYPTAADALANFTANNSYYLSASGGYVNAYGHTQSTALEGYYDENTWEGHGWNYAIVRNTNEIVDNGDIFSASVMQLEDDDVVFWVFGTYDDLEEYVQDYLDNLPD